VPKVTEMNVLQRAISNTVDQTRDKSEILSVLHETLGSVGENDEDNTSSGTSTASPKENQQYGSMQMSVDPHDDLVDQLTTDQKSEIVNFYNINPDLSEDIIRENYAEKFKKIITPDMLSKIIRPGHDVYSKLKEPNKKKLKTDQIPQIEEYILHVINESETNDVKLTVADLKNRAITFAKDNGQPTFNPSKGWILRFLQLWFFI
jgi:hypothetical protein